MQDSLEVLDLHLLLDIMQTIKSSINPEENFDKALLGELSQMIWISKLILF